MKKITTMKELLNERLSEEDIIKLVANYDNKFNELEKENKEKSKKIKRLNNNWNKLKKWIEEYRDGTGLSEYETGISDALYDILKKMKALQGSDKE